MSDEPPSGPSADEPSGQPALRPGPNSDDFDPKQHVWDGHEWWTLDHQYRWDGSRWQPRDAPRTTMLPGPWPAQRVPGNPVHQRDFWFGFGGWITVNVILLILLTQLPVDSKSAVGGALLIANVLALILLAFLRGYVALGMVTAFATALAVVVVEGIFFTLSDFAGGLYSTGTMVGFLVTGGLLFAVVAFFLLRAIHRSIR